MHLPALLRVWHLIRMSCPLIRDLRTDGKERFRRLQPLAVSLVRHMMDDEAETVSVSGGGSGSSKVC